MEKFVRNEILYGESYAAICKKKIAIFGLGGVGGYTVEALARFGVENFLLIDGDNFSESNINRQILALQDTIGRPKTEVCAERINKINSNAKVEARNIFFTQEDEINFDGVDLIVDAIDTVTSKLLLVEIANRRGIKIISAMGCGNKFDPTKLKIADITQTSVCPLCRVMRRELKERGIMGLKVVYSDELPKNINIGTENGRHPPASSPFVPSVAGLLIAYEAIEML